MTLLDLANRKIAKLEDDLAAQRELTLWWKEQLCGRSNLYVDPVLRLTPSEGLLLVALWSRNGGYLSREALLAAVAGPVDDPPEIKIVDVYVSKIRRKLEPIGAAIRTIWGEGYCLEPPSRRRLTPFIVNAQVSVESTSK